MLSAFSEWIDTATPLIPAGALRPKLCHSPISYPLTQCTMMCNSSFKPAPFPSLSKPMANKIDECSTLNARLTSKKIHPRSGCSWWHCLHHDWARRCPIRQRSQESSHHEEHQRNSLQPSLLQAEHPGWAWAASQWALARAQLSRALFFLSGWIVIKSFIKLIACVENGCGSEWLRKP